ncbi:MAG: tRNA pseudouridine(55) synthase TruB [Oscillospiraceae bacterium]|nr:tRNA pseudouridine(55) synthase TruB [Oscillospiraceae bacterium]
MNGVIIIDKSVGWTSHDVVGKLRGIFREKRIGHGGTLDPMATGVLPVFVGRATRAVEFCENYEKEYVAGFRTGIKTDTQDITGSVIAESDRAVTLSDIKAVLPQFTGDIMQIPPMYSALKVNGQKLYELARKGVEVERKARPITIRELELTESGELRILCSKGTYIRTLINDIGDALGCGAVMTSLRRTKAGAFTLGDAHTIDEVIGLAASGEAGALLRPVDSLFGMYPAIFAHGDEIKKIYCGATYPCHASDGMYCVYDECGAFLMLGEAKSGMMRTVKSFFEPNHR